MWRSIFPSCSCALLLSTIACGQTTPTADGKPDAKSDPAATPEPPKPLPEVDTAAPEPVPPPPEPTIEQPPPPTAAARLPIPPTPDLAVVQTAKGVEVLDETGKSIATLIPHAVSWCRVDPRAEVLWFRHGDEGTVSFLDLRSSDPATKLLDASPFTFEIDYGDESLGHAEDHQFEEGLVLHMQSPAKLEGILGCGGDLVFTCFGDEDPEDWPEGEIDYDALLAKRRAQLEKDAAATPILAPDKLAALVARSAGRRATLPDPKRSPEPTPVANVPKDRCEDYPEMCGEARRLLGTPYWIVVVENSRGDFYHEFVQLYDPAKLEFFDALDPTRRSATPMPDSDDEFTPTWVSPSGTMLSDHTRLVKLGSGVVAKDLEGSCGFWGGGWEIAIPG